MKAAPVLDPVETPAPKTPPRKKPQARRESTPRPERQAPRIWDKSPWSFLFSITVGIWLLVALTIASIIGTLIDPLERAQAVIYYTPWFKGLLLALAVTMTCSTYKTLVTKVLPTFVPRIFRNADYYEYNELAESIPCDQSPEQVADAFRKGGFAVRVDGDAGAARTGWIGLWGAPVAHLGLVMVLISGFVANWVASEGFVQIPEGHGTTSMTLRGTDGQTQPLGFALTVDDFDTDFFPRTRIPSHFISTVTATSEQGELLYQGPVEVNHSPTINGWTLHQTSYQELKGLARNKITVEGPGLKAPANLEASPGQSVLLAGSGGLSVALDNHMGWQIKRGTEVVAKGAAAGGHDHGSRLTLKANRFEPDFILGADRQATSRSQELNNPALNVTLLSDGAPAAQQWLFGREDMKAFSHSTSGHFNMELIDVTVDDGTPHFVVAVSDGSSGALIGRVLLGLGEEGLVADAKAEPEDEATAAAATAGWNVSIGATVPAYATVLTVTRNPAIPVIYAACGLMMLGLILGFFVRRRNVWFMLDREAGMLRVAATYRHPSETFDSATLAVLNRLRGTAAN